MHHWACQNVLKDKTGNHIRMLIAYTSAYVDFEFIGLQHIKTRAESDSSTVLIFETNILRVPPVNFEYTFQMI